jgi:hypothetical protein
MNFGHLDLFGHILGGLARNDIYSSKIYAFPLAEILQKDVAYGPTHHFYSGYTSVFPVSPAYILHYNGFF